MIYINRDRNDENGNPIKPPSQWFASAGIATKTAIRENGQHKADEKIYGHDHVRAALEKLFYDKCAYCESKIEGLEVEHFRPKGCVHERRDDHPGYYWLTYYWGNLYISCTPCNQHRKDKPRWDDFTYGDTAGKATQFPLEDESTRVMSHHKDICQESILLLDPCNDDPEQYLTYNPLGEIDACKGNSRGLKTIEVFHLYRKRLKDRRRDCIKSAVKIIKAIRKFESAGDNEAVEELRSLLVDDNGEFAGATRAVNNDPDAFCI